MKKMLMAVAAVATLGTAAAAMPAAAQPYGGGGYGGGYGGYGHGGGIDARQDEIQNRIARAERNGRLNHREARRLREQLWEIKRIEARYRYDRHLSRWERSDLDQRLDRLAWRVRQEVRDDDYGHGGPRPRW
ncbi:hypothetical protein [Caulobacter sp. NIBR1757]|uniref:hypothetical protein n=1 Tax=Caulobacter sp. NIBR1757 TaxID=3016000 RepID=UPI0022F139E9|nr:hypothetical protein [Caulobacter sp. NIBR1757]WGM38542.1 hypothetical protein AMEJIAPC_01445 [Caulobacter sp. NIBR1757]